MLRPCTPVDAEQICGIYNHYVRETVVTFEESPVTPADMARRIADVTTRLPWLVWEVDGTILGYAYATPWKARAAYRYAVEASIYLSESATGRGLGSRLYLALIDQLRQKGGGVFTQADLPFASEALSPLRNLVRKGWAKLGHEALLGAESKKGLPQIHPAVSTDDQRLSLIAELRLFGQALAVRRLEQFGALQDN